jgi:DnaJ family protein C protein 9
VLSDPVKRKRYDETGEISDQNLFEDMKDADDWDAYFRELWTGVVSEETIEQFEKEYKESDEEKRDLLNAYTEFEGNMDEIMENVMLASCDDEVRFIKKIKQAIKDGEVESYKAFKTTTTKKAREARLKMQESEAKEAEEMRKEKGINDENALAQLIQKNQKGRMEAIIGNLESKYGGKRKAEMSEEEFIRVQDKLFKKQ